MRAQNLHGHGWREMGRWDQGCPRIVVEKAFLLAVGWNLGSRPELEAGLHGPANSLEIQGAA